MSVISFLALNMLLLSPFPGVEQIESALDLALLAKASRLELVASSGKFSYAQYHEEPHSSAPAKAPFPRHTLAPNPVPFGSFREKNGVLYRQAGGHCGYLIPLSDPLQSINLLGFQEVILTGQFRGRWRVAFADQRLAALEENVTLGELSGSGSSYSFSLEKLVQRADLSRARYLVLLLESPSGAAQLKEVTFQHLPRPARAGRRGTWIWQRELVLGREDEVLKRLAGQGINRAYLQVGDDPEVFDSFLRKAARQGVEVYALDGSPGYIAAPDELLARIRRVEAYNESHPDARFAGFQTDIEPYLNKDFASRKEYYVTGYADLVEEIRRRSRLSLSVVVPFWFDSLHTGTTSLLQQVAQIADEVVVMSYRTDSKLLLEISRSALALGQALGKPVWLGVELGPIPDEEHLELERCPAASRRAVRIGGSWWCPVARYQVPGSRISFSSRMEELPVFLNTPIPFASFQGWVLHSYQEVARHDR